MEGRSLPAAITSGGEIVGSIGARIDSYAGTADIGYWIDVDAQGRGLVTRAAKVLVSQLHDDCGIGRLEIRAAVENVRSRAVAERLGFTLKGKLRAAQVVGERAYDVALYGLVPYRIFRRHLSGRSVPVRDARGSGVPSEVTLHRGGDDVAHLMKETVTSIRHDADLSGGETRADDVRVRDGHHAVCRAVEDEGGSVNVRERA